MNIGVVGNRSFDDYELVEKTLSDFIREKELTEVVIISGGATGADSLAEKFAIENRYQSKIFYPNWEEYGRAAGPIRNKLIVENSEIIFVFWNGAGKGTQSTISIAEKMNVQVIKVVKDGRI